MSKENQKQLRKKLAGFCKKMFGHNLSVKILSILGAVVFWLLIVNINDPYKTKVFLVHVTTINEEALTAVNKVYEITEGSTASVTVRAHRSFVDSIDSSDIVAEADLSELSSVNAVTVRASLKEETTSDVTLDCTTVMKVSLEDMETKQVKVTVDTEGTPADGYSIGECTAKPNVIEVTGGESVIDRISTVRVTLNVNGASENFSKRLEPVAYDKKDHKITSSTLTFSKDTVKVRAKIMQNKTVSVKAEISGTPAYGYEYIETSCLPETIEVAGTQKLLENISEIVIPISIDGLKSNSSELEQEIRVEDYVPEDTIIPEEYQTISVQIVIEKLKTKKIQLKVDDLTMKNLADGYVAGVYNTTGVVNVTIQARESVIDSLPDLALSGYIDCEGLTAGRYQLPIKMDMDKTCSLVRKVKVVVVISKKKKTSQATQEPDAAETPSVSDDAVQEEEEEETEATKEPE